jgi:arginyl-tRNA synthetase
LPTYEAEGAVWVRSTDFGDERDRVLIRSPERGGTPTYEAADIVYLMDKLDRGFDRAIYVLGADHQDVRGWFSVVARMLGYDPIRVEVLIYQLVHLTKAGEQTKMSKRRGDVVFLDDFMDEVGVDAARWYLIASGHDQTVTIDVDLAAQKTQKNPVYYVQYAHARIAGILRNAGDAAVSAEPPADLAPEEKDLVKRLAEFPVLVAEATERRAPHAIPIYAIRVADDFHRFYHRHRVLESEAQAFRLALVRSAQAVIARSLALVGVEAPERM